MKINVANIPEEGLKIQFSKDENWYKKLSAEREDLGFSLKEVAAALTVKRIQETLYLEGEVQAVVEAECSRCLDPARLFVRAPFKYVLAPKQPEHQEEKELSPEDLDLVFYEGDLIDLDPLIVEQIFLQVPMKILCREDCKGLCPRCGINLNRETCQCPEKPIDVRFEVLKKLKL